MTKQDLLTDKDFRTIAEKINNPDSHNLYLDYYFWCSTCKALGLNGFHQIETKYKPNKKINWLHIKFAYDGNNLFRKESVPQDIKENANQSRMHLIPGVGGYVCNHCNEAAYKIGED